MIIVSENQFSGKTYFYTIVPSSSYWQMGLVPQELFGFTFVYGYYWTVYFRWGS